jgi:hypothetical protein
VGGGKAQAKGGVAVANRRGGRARRKSGPPDDHITFKRTRTIEKRYTFLYLLWLLFQTFSFINTLIYQYIPIITIITQKKNVYI